MQSQQAVLEGVGNVIEQERETEREHSGSRFLDVLQDFGGCAVEGAVALIKSGGDKS